METETHFLKFWRALNATQAANGLDDVPLGLAWKFYRNAYQGR